MSYNKVEALREKSDAEKLLLSNDYIAARTKLKKAQQLFPALDHITPMLTVCDILSSSTNIIPGYETDYYWVLQLMPSSNLSDITSQYQKLTSLLQPIKYKFPATETALKLLQDAYSVLSDKKKRVTFDIKRGISWVNYESFETNGVDNNNGDKVHVNNITLQESGGSSSSEVVSEGQKGQFTDINSGTQKVQDKTIQQDYYSFDSFRTPECFTLKDIWAVHCCLSEPFIGGRYGQICKRLGGVTEITWLKPIPVTEGERRWFDAGLPVACGSFCLDTEPITIESKGVFSYKCAWDPGVTEELFEIYPKKGEVWALYQDFDLEEWSYNPDVIKDCSFKLVEIVSEYSIYTGVECVPLVKVNGFESIFERIEGENVILHVGPRDLYMLAHNVPAYRFTGEEIGGVHEGMLELDQLALRKPSQESEDLTVSKKKEKDKDKEKEKEKEMEFVDPTQGPPGPDTTVLGPNWSVNDFTTGQVWAVYTGRDSMPRQYVIINNMMSPTRLSATVLEPDPVQEPEQGSKNRSFPIVCGTFRSKDTVLNFDLSQLSHSVNCYKSMSSSVYKIFPLKGEIWAVYRNWKSGFSRLSYDNYKCWVVEILSDFTDGEKMMVARLVEVKGCLTFYERLQGEDGFEMVRGFSKRELTCFSHRIPAFRVPGIGRHGIPESSWHLEPVALPPPDN